MLGCRFSFFLRRGRKLHLSLPPTDDTGGIHMFSPVSLLLCVIVLLHLFLAPSPGAYYTVSDDRVPQMVPDHSKSSKSEVVRYGCGLPQTVCWPGSLRDPSHSYFRKWFCYLTHVLRICTRVYHVRIGLPSSFPLNYSLRHYPPLPRVLTPPPIPILCDENSSGFAPSPTRTL